VPVLITVAGVTAGQGFGMFVDVFIMCVVAAIAWLVHWHGGPRT
jgi:hypothetical protein